LKRLSNLGVRKNRFFNPFFSPVFMLTEIKYYLTSKKQIFAVSFSRLSDSLGGGAVYFALPLFISKINPSTLPNAFLAGMVIAMWGIVATIVQPFFGVWIDKKGKPKFLLVVGLLLTSFVILTYTVVKDLYSLFTVRIPLGLLKPWL